METRDLRYFLAVAEELHFGRAAQRLNMSQPPLSQAIRKLEDELGVKLFERSSRNVALTRAGQFLRKEAQEILDRTETAEKTLRRMGRGETGCLRIGLVGPALEGGMACTIRNFRLACPTMEIDLRQRSTSDQLSDLLSDKLDVGIVRLFGHSEAGLETVVYSTERYLLAIPRGHHLAGQEVVTVRDLDGEQMLTFPREAHPHLYDELISCYRRAGACPNLLNVSMYKHTINTLVATGMGLALMPEGMARTTRPGVIYKAIEGELPPVEFSLAWKAGNSSPLVRRFVETVLETTQDCV